MFIIHNRIQGVHVPTIIVSKYIGKHYCICVLAVSCTLSTKSHIEIKQDTEIINQRVILSENNENKLCCSNRIDKDNMFSRHTIVYIDIYLVLIGHMLCYV